MTLDEELILFFPNDIKWIVYRYCTECTRACLAYKFHNWHFSGCFSEFKCLICNRERKDHSMIICHRTNSGGITKPGILSKLQNRWN